MRNTYKIVWSEESITNLKEIIDYLNDTWTEKELKKFSQKLDNLVLTISLSPEIFPTTNRNQKVRKAVLSKLTTVYYQIEGQTVNLISIFLNKKDPKKLKI